MNSRGFGDLAVVCVADHGLVASEAASRPGYATELPDQGAGHDHACHLRVARGDDFLDVVAKVGYAVQDTVWVTRPGPEPWKVYAVTGDARPDLEGKPSLDLSEVSGDGTCCTTDRVDADTSTEAKEKQTAAAYC